MMQETIQQGGGQDGIREDLIPGAIAFVGSENDRLVGFITLADDFEEQGGIDPLQGDLADFVEDP